MDALIALIAMDPMLFAALSVLAFGGLIVKIDHDIRREWEEQDRQHEQTWDV
jgi:hypothetical protein